MSGQFRTNFLYSLPVCPCCGRKRTKGRFFLAGGGMVYRCRDCSVKFLSPQPDEAQLKKLYSENYYAAWGISGHQDNESTRSMKRATFRLRLALIRRFLQPYTDLRLLTSASPDRYSRTLADAASPDRRPHILDVGCATGYFLELAEEEGFKPYGVEFSAYAAARARLRFGPDAIFQGTLEQSTFPKNDFTAIALSDLLEHTPSPQTTLTTAASLLQPAGVILIMTPDTRSLSHFIMGRRWTHYKPEHLFYFNHRSLTQLANRCGLELVHFERGKKALNLAYLYTQFRVYRHWLFTPLINILHKLAPQKLRDRNFYLSIGEMVVILQKKP